MEPPSVIKWAVGIIGGVFVGVIAAPVSGILLYRLIVPFSPHAGAIALIVGPILGLVAGVLSCRASLRRNVKSFRLSEGDSYPLGHCQHCGYNLTGNVTGICSECGSPV